MKKTGQSLSLTQLSLLSPSPQECKKEKKVKANYVGVQSVVFFTEKGWFSGEKTKQNIILSNTKNTLPPF